MVALYQGEFMAGFSLPDCPDFEDWLRLQRAALKRRALALLEQLACGHERLDDPGTALRFALRYLALEPWDEAACRRVMRLYAAIGQYSAALAQFDTCCQLLKQELGVLPGEETRQLAERVRQGEWQQRAPRPAPTRPAALLPQRPGRRQVTVLYCELGTDAIGDPEEAMELLAAPQARCIEIIGHFCGHLVPSHRAGLLAYFGYPQAHEDAARRAVQAALAMTRLVTPGVALRAGVHTGLIMTGDDVLVPDTLGQTTRLATQLRYGAARHGVAISLETRRIVGGYFTCTPVSALVLPGCEQPLELFRVAAESGALTRLEAAAQLTPMTGRLAELAQLTALWDSAVQGQSAVLLIQGEAGIGKSRLLHTLRQRLAGQSHAVRELRCFPEFSQSPLHPLIMMLEAIVGFGGSDTPEQKWATLRRYLKKLGAVLSPADLLLFADLLGLPTHSPARTSGYSAQKAKKHTLHLVLGMLQAVAAERPTLLVVEDLHWVDPSTLELLSLYVNSARRGAVLALFTARPEFAPPWPPARYATLALGPLPQHDIVTMLAARSAQLSPATVQSIVARADGVPLFAEEMASLAALGDLASVPASLQDLLAARIDRLGAAKACAQLAATLGREFDLPMLQKLLAINPEAVAQQVQALSDAGLLLPLKTGMHQFKHALIQQAAYQSQSRAQRQAAHRRISELLLRDFPEHVAKRPELVAQHLADGGDQAGAIDYWCRAAQRAALVCANQEAIGHYRAALQLLPGLPTQAQQNHTELKLLLGLSPVLYAVKGYGCEEAEGLTARIAALNTLPGNDGKLFQTRWALMVSSMASSSSRGMPQAALQLLNLAQDDPMKKMAAHALAAIASFWLGDFAVARQHDEQALALYHPNQRLSLLRQFGSDLVVNCNAYLACTLYFLGYPEQAQTVCLQMLAQVRTQDHPHTLAQALSFAALLQRWLNRQQQAQVLAAETIAISRQHDFHLWRACGEMTHGWARVMQGQADGLAEIESSIATMRQALGGMSVVFLSSQIEACMHLQQFDRALALTAQALADAAKTGDAHFLPELYRLKGVCLLSLDAANAVPARACLQQALAISGQQKAKPMALRAATSLVRLGGSPDQIRAAQQDLQAIYHSFTEGWHSHDLQQAAACLLVGPDAST